MSVVNSVFVKLWQASVWNTTPFCLHSSYICFIGCTVPISLFACIMLTIATSLLISFFNCSKSIIPSLPTLIYLILYPFLHSSAHVPRTAGCSISLVIMHFLSGNALHTPFIARLSDSVPPDVNMISSGFAPMLFAMAFLAFSSACLAFCPYECTEDAFPYSSVR